MGKRNVRVKAKSSQEQNALSKFKPLSSLTKTVDGEKQLSKGQRKRLKKKSRKETLLDKLNKSALVDPLVLNKPINPFAILELHKGLSDTPATAVTAAINSNCIPSRPKSASLSSKAKRNAVKKESAHAQKVYEHASFLQDPLGALRQHVSNTVAQTQVAMTLPQINNNHNKKKNKTRKKKEN